LHYEIFENLPPADLNTSAIYRVLLAFETIGHPEFAAQLLIPLLPFPHPQSSMPKSPTLHAFVLWQLIHRLCLTVREVVLLVAQPVLSKGFVRGEVRVE